MKILIIFLYLCIVDRLEVISQLKTEAFTASTFLYKRNLNAKNMIGIYKITSPSNKIYIGQSTDIEGRIKGYKSLSCKKQTRLLNIHTQSSLFKHKDQLHLLPHFKLVVEKFIGKTGITFEFTFIVWTAYITFWFYAKKEKWSYYEES